MRYFFFVFVAVYIFFLTYKVKYTKRVYPFQGQKKLCDIYIHRIYILIHKMMTDNSQQSPGVPIRTPFVLRNQASQDLTARQIQMETQFLTLPIPILYNSEAVASIIGVGQSGREFVMNFANHTVYSGLQAFVDHLVSARAYHTRHAADSTRQQLRLSLRGKQATLDAWFDMLCGWADTHLGTVACIKASVQIPDRPLRTDPPAQPNQIIRLPEPPLRPPAIQWNNTPPSPETVTMEPLPTIAIEDPMVVEEDYSEEEYLVSEDPWGMGMESDVDSLPDLEDSAPHRAASRHLEDIVRDIVGGEGLLTLSTVRQHHHHPQVDSPPTECTICYGELTEGLTPPCGHAAHVVCGECLGRYATNWSCHCVSANTPFVACPHEGCEEPYTVATIARYVNERDLGKLKERIAHYVERQTVGFACPTCHQITRVPSRLVKDRAPGSLAVKCAAHGCGMEFCWHCLDRVPQGLANDHGFALRRVCGNCEARAECAIPPRSGEFNRFVPKKGTVGIIPRNYELTVEDCMAQLQWIATTPQLETRCRACAVPMHRTTACSELTHCGLRQCTVCGMGGLEFESNLIDHWAGHGRLGQCPRWSTDRFWRQTIRCPRKDRCCENECHTDERDCTVKAHENYRSQVLEVRRLRHFKCLMQSLPPELQRMVVEEIVRGDASHRSMVELFNKIRLATDFGALI